MKTDELLADLNEEQRAAVVHTAGPLLIVAGAGTGKTTVMTRRLAYLIREGHARPEELLALTFTEKAAEEMEERIDRLLPAGYVDLWTLTFHAFCERILRAHAIEIGLDPGFKLLSAAEQWLFVRKHLFDFELKYFRPLGNPTRFIYALVSHFSRAKDENIGPEAYLLYAEKLAKETTEKLPNISDEDERARLSEESEKALELAHAYATYQRLMQEAGQMDFGDLILYTLQLFETRKSVLAQYHKQFKYLVVDEFQDTNFAQYELVKMLSQPVNNLTVCGDDDQSIYKFRGAAVSNILGFQRDFPTAQQVVLTRNYRSSQAILDLAYSSIQLNNPDRLEAKLKIDKHLVAESKIEGVPEVLHFETEHDEALGVVKKIVEIKQGNKDRGWNDFAILVRANAQAQVYIQMLERSGIPFQFVASRGLYTSPEIMDLTAYLRLLTNPFDNVSLFRVLTSPYFQFEMMDVAKLQSLARRQNVTLLDMLRDIDSISGVSKTSVESADRFLNILTRHTHLAKTKTALQVIYQIVSDVGYFETLLSKNEKNSADTKKILNISEFLKQVKSFEATQADSALANFIDELDLLQEAGEDPSPANPEEGPDAVHIMTIHQAKGLEFECVFVVNMVADRFPSRSRTEPIPLPQALIRESVPAEEAHLQEERRLFYVAMTRAKGCLFLTCAKNYGGKRTKKPSIFLQEVSAQLKSSYQEGSASLTPEEPEEVSNTETPVSLAIPNKFSFTQLAAFETCPRQYQYAHIFRIQPPGRHTFSYGQSLHKALELFSKQLIETQSATKEDLLNFLDESWVSDWYESKAQEATQKKQGIDTLTRYYDAHAATMRPSLFIEKDFNLKIGDATFRGKIDRIDEVEGGVEILDYKTGKVKKQKDVDADEQLSLYALAATKVLGLKPVKLSLYFLDEGKKVTTTRSEEVLAGFEAQVEETVAAIRASSFSPTPGFQCQFCDFLNICDAGLRKVGKR